MNYQIPEWIADRIVRQTKIIEQVIKEMPADTFVQSLDLINNFAYLKGYLEAVMRINNREEEMTDEEEKAHLEEVITKMDKEKRSAQ